jgi:hypothetical protein
LPLAAIYFAAVRRKLAAAARSPVSTS